MVLTTCFNCLVNHLHVQELIELEDMKKTTWEYNGKYYLKINAVKVKKLPVETCFQKDVPFYMDLSFSKYGFQKMESRLQVIAFLKLIKIHYSIKYIYIYIQNGLIRISFKTF